MYPKDHILYSTIFCIVLIPIFGFWDSLIVFLAAIFIDTDHYIRYVFITKDWSIKNSIKYYYDKTKKRYHELYILHTLEFWLLLLLLGFYSPVFTFILLGVLYHMVLDFIDMFQKKYYEIRIYSVVLWLIDKF